MDAEARQVTEAAGYSAPGFAERYDRYRPRPPAALVELVPPLAGVGRPHRVVDIGSGTGLSTRIWAGYADEVIGVEPNDAMRTLAEEVTDASNVRYIGASAYQTGLAGGCADVVTAAQSLQWMRPERVLPEIRRILRPGGVLCVEMGDGARMLGFALSEGSMTTLLAAGASEADIGLDRLRRVASTLSEPLPWWISYKAVVALA